MSTAKVDSKPLCFSLGRKMKVLVRRKWARLRATLVRLSIRQVFLICLIRTHRSRCRLFLALKKVRKLWIFLERRGTWKVARPLNSTVSAMLNPSPDLLTVTLIVNDPTRPSGTSSQVTWSLNHMAARRAIVKNVTQTLLDDPSR